MQGASVGRGVRALRELRGGLRSFASAPLGGTASTAEAAATTAAPAATAATATMYSDAMYVPPKPMPCQLTQRATALRPACLRRRWARTRSPVRTYGDPWGAQRWEVQRSRTGNGRT